VHSVAPAGQKLEVLSPSLKRNRSADKNSGASLNCAMQEPPIFESLIAVDGAGRHGVRHPASTSE
jgi:hypothetical protein